VIRARSFSQSTCKGWGFDLFHCWDWGSVASVTTNAGLAFIWSGSRLQYRLSRRESKGSSKSDSEPRGEDVENRPKVTHKSGHDVENERVYDGWMGGTQSLP